ncbi:MAG: hypothetical protein PHY80_03880 [Rickettsiales bacterium]|nr:hypothetical protein [Rickettsiales bacterium]
MYSIKLNKTIKDISSLNKIHQNNQNAFKLKTGIEELHKTVSDILFKAIKKENYNIIKQIITNSDIRAELVRDENGLNIIQYSVVNSNNELFKALYYNYYEDIRCYFSDIPQLFLLILNRKNYELMKLFLFEKKLYEKLTKENISLLVYSLVQENKDALLDIVLQNDYIDEEIDGKCIQSILIYLISNEQNGKFQKICLNEKLFSKCKEEHIRNLIALSIMNKNIKALEIMVDNLNFLNIILHDNQILENVVLFTYINKNIKVLSTIFRHRTETTSQIFQTKNSNGVPLFEDSL